jgi:hypothetical protein
VLSSGNYAAPGPWLHGFAFDFTAASNLSARTFKDDVNNWTFSTDSLLDNVVVADTHPVPEPASIALLTLGLAGIGALRRRQR